MGADDGSDAPDLARRVGEVLGDDLVEEEGHHRAADLFHLDVLDVADVADEVEQSTRPMRDLAAP